MKAQKKRCSQKKPKKASQTETQETAGPLIEPNLAFEFLKFGRVPLTRKEAIQIQEILQKIVGFSVSLEYVPTLPSTIKELSSIETVVDAYPVFEVFRDQTKLENEFLILNETFSSTTSKSILKELETKLEKEAKKQLLEKFPMHYAEKESNALLAVTATPNLVQSQPLLDPSEKEEQVEGEEHKKTLKIPSRSSWVIVTLSFLGRSLEKPEEQQQLAYWWECTFELFLLETCEKLQLQFDAQSFTRKLSVERNKKEILETLEPKLPQNFSSAELLGMGINIKKELMPPPWLSYMEGAQSLVPRTTTTGPTTATISTEASATPATTATTSSTATTATTTTGTTTTTATTATTSTTTTVSTSTTSPPNTGEGPPPPPPMNDNDGPPPPPPPMNDGDGPPPPPPLTPNTSTTTATTTTPGANPTAAATTIPGTNPTTATITPGINPTTTATTTPGTNATTAATTTPGKNATTASTTAAATPVIKPKPTPKTINLNLGDYKNYMEEENEEEKKKKACKLKAIVDNQKKTGAQWDAAQMSISLAWINLEKTCDPTITLALKKGVSQFSQNKPEEIKLEPQKPEVKPKNTSTLSPDPKNQKKMTAKELQELELLQKKPPCEDKWENPKSHFSLEKRREEDEPRKLEVLYWKFKTEKAGEQKWRFEKIVWNKDLSIQESVKTTHVANAAAFYLEIDGYSKIKHQKDYEKGRNIVFWLFGVPYATGLSPKYWFDDGDFDLPLQVCTTRNPLVKEEFYPHWTPEKFKIKKPEDASPTFLTYGLQWASSKVTGQCSPFEQECFDKETKKVRCVPKDCVLSSSISDDQRDEWILGNQQANVGNVDELLSKSVITEN